MLCLIEINKVEWKKLLLAGDVFGVGVDWLDDYGWLDVYN